MQHVEAQFSRMVNILTGGCEPTAMSESCVCPHNGDCSSMVCSTMMGSSLRSILAVMRVNALDSRAHVQQAVQRMCATPARQYENAWRIAGCCLLKTCNEHGTCRSHAWMHMHTCTFTPARKQQQQAGAGIQHAVNVANLQLLCAHGNALAF